ncbi:MAG: DUF2062 domain-containing protein [Thiotrichales bacterium]
MPRKLLKRLLPAPSQIRSQKWLGPVRDWLHDPNIWHLNRDSVSGAVAIGLFMVFIPAPSQMVVAAILAIVFRVNLPIAASLVWISNPFTFAPIGLAALKLGEWLTGIPAGVAQFDFSFTWLLSELPKIWAPLMLGLVTMAVVSSALGYFISRWLWRCHVVWQYRKRKGHNPPKRRKT